MKNIFHDEHIDDEGNSTDYCGICKHEPCDCVYGAEGTLIEQEEDEELGDGHERKAPDARGFSWL
jgi:hypothetical protein